MKQIVKAVGLTIILGVPVFWYLFLQLFGENQFELPYVGQVNPVCDVSDFKLYLIGEVENVDHQNELVRLQEAMGSREIEFTFSDQSSCFETNVPLVLVGANGSIVGYYDLTEEEVDRAIVEVDLLVHVTNNNNEGK